MAVIVVPIVVPSGPIEPWSLSWWLLMAALAIAVPTLLWTLVELWRTRGRY